MLEQRGQLLRIAVGFFLGACAIQNTPQQDLAYARWAKCDAPYVQLDRVDVDGRITFKFSSEGTRQEIRQCLAEAIRWRLTWWATWLSFLVGLTLSAFFCGSPANALLTKTGLR